MKIVEFKNGTFGVRIGSWFNGYEFADMYQLERTWCKQGSIIENCQGSLESAILLMARLEGAKYTVLHGFFRVDIS